MADLVDATRDLFKLCPLNPGPAFQHFAHAPQLLSCGAEPIFSLGHVHADPEHFPHLSPVVENALIGPEYRDPFAAAQDIFMNTESIAIRVAHQLRQKGCHIPALKSGKGSQCAQHRLADNLHSRVAEEALAVVVQERDLALTVETQNNGPNVLHHEPASV